MTRSECTAVARIITKRTGMSHRAAIALVRQHHGLVDAAVRNRRRPSEVAEDILERAGKHGQRDPKLDKKALWRSINADEKARQRAHVAELRQRVRKLETRRKTLRGGQREACELEISGAKTRIAELRIRMRAELNAAVDAEKRGARLRCRERRTNPRLAVQRARAELRAERAHQAALRRTLAANRASARAARALRPGLSRGRASERMSESDDEVRQNIPRELVPLFERTKRSIKASGRKSRTEAFLQYAEEHPREHLGGIDDATERMIREHERALRAGGR